MLEKSFNSLNISSLSNLEDLLLKNTSSPKRTHIRYSPERFYEMMDSKVEFSGNLVHETPNNNQFFKKKNISKYSESSETRDKRSVNNNKVDSVSASINHFTSNHSKNPKTGKTKNLIKSIKSPSINISDLLTES